MGGPGGQHTEHSFAATRWTLVERLRDGDDAARREAAETLARIYSSAVYAWLRRQGYRRDAAADAAQAFFADVVLGRGLFERARPERGRLRNFMLTALDRYLVDLHRARSREQRCLGWRLPLENAEREERFLGMCNGEPPGAVFERRWALATVEEALRRCERHFVRAGRQAHWRAFEARILHPAVTGATPPPLRTLAESLNAATPAEVASMVQVVRKRLDALLREVVAETVTGEKDRGDEYRRLATVLV